MSSNAGAREISRDSRLGFGAGNGIMSMGEIESQALAELRRLFNPEFLNRVDETIVFHPLDMKQVGAVFDIQAGELRDRLLEQGYDLRILPSARKILIEKGWDPKFGGRPLRRTIQRELEDPLSELILNGSWPEGTVFSAGARKEKIRLSGKIPVRTAGPVETGSLIPSL
jgi:ATP-dependent Clp protease ATP-binding subunit ClpC